MKHPSLLILLFLVLIPIAIYFFFPQTLQTVEQQTIITPVPLTCSNTQEPNTQNCNGESCNNDLDLCVQESTCELLQGNGSADKIDLLFITDGYSRTEAKEVIATLLGEKIYQGLYTTKPFNGTQHLHNIWLTSTNTTTGNLGNLPDTSLSIVANAECPQADKTITLSKKTFRSYCYFSGDCYLSIGKYQPLYWGKLFLHEYGHGFGGLADEYEEPTLGDRSKYPNCAPDEETARQWLSQYFQNTTSIAGCSYVADNYRFTENSIMRQHLTQTSYGPVNEAHIRTILDKYETTPATTGDYGLVQTYLASRDEGTESITLTPLGIKKGALPQFQTCNYTATLSDGTTTLSTTNFTLTTQHEYEAPPTFFNEKGTQVLFEGEHYTFSTAYSLIVVPYDTRATRLSITDEKGTVRATQNLSALSQCNGICEAGETCASDCAVNYCLPPTLSIMNLLKQGNTHVTFDDDGKGTVLTEREGFMVETTVGKS